MRAVVVMLALVGCVDARDLSGACTTDCTADVHAPGILDVASPGFHGRVLAENDWSFPLCASCHGADFSGGVSKVSCLGCHRDGPTACTTCHGAGPTSNAHPAHAASITCADCHVVPERWDDDGHIIHDGHAIATPATVRFGARASLGTGRVGQPSWDGETCTNVYCHGDTLHAGGTTPEPRWDDPTPAGVCTTCHGNPPPNHLRNDCGSCHPRSAPHVDGIVQVGTTCNGCHGSATSNAPPMDLAGNTFTTAIGVGAHQAHLQALSRISAPVPCAACHLVPASIDAPGHIDTLPPAEVTASLGWDRSALTCSTAWCHGVARPSWTSSGAVSCGSCHGVPPLDAPHTPAMTLTTCTTCHPRTVDPFGNIIVIAGASEHINGVVDLR